MLATASACARAEAVRAPAPNIPCLVKISSLKDGWGVAAFSIVFKNARGAVAASSCRISALCAESQRSRAGCADYRQSHQYYIEGSGRKRGCEKVENIYYVWQWKQLAAHLPSVNKRDGRSRLTPRTGTNAQCTPTAPVAGLVMGVGSIGGMLS